MERRLEYYLMIFLLLLVWFPCYPLMFPCSGVKNTQGSYSLPHTELNISKVQLSYFIHTTGKYFCTFSLEVIGSILTELGSAQCTFTVSGLNISNLILNIDNIPVKPAKTKNQTCLIIRFTTENHSFLDQSIFTIQGSYDGHFISNISSIYTFELGIDWGTTVGAQYTTVEFTNDYTIGNISPEYPEISTNYGIWELSWNEMFVQGFHSTLKLHHRRLPNTFIDIPIQPWNVTIGQIISIPIKNLWDYNITIMIITPNWISTNVSYYTLVPDQKIITSFLINSLASPGMNDTIRIVIEELWEPIVIPVTVVDVEPQDGIFPILLFVSCFTGFCIIGLGYYKREAINEQINHWRKGKGIIAESDSISSTSHIVLSETVELTWDTIQTRWESILPEQELKVIKILFEQRVINQKTIAEQLGVSEVKMSRIISRLETKRLLVRERLGMSNMIKLNEQKL